MDYWRDGMMMVWGTLTCKTGLSTEAAITWQAHLHAGVWGVGASSAWVKLVCPSRQVETLLFYVRQDLPSETGSNAISSGNTCGLDS